MAFKFYMVLTFGFCISIKLPSEPRGSNVPWVRIGSWWEVATGPLLLSFSNWHLSSFWHRAEVSPSVAGAEVNRNTRSGQCLFFRPLKFLQVNFQNSFLDQCTMLPDFLLQVWEWPSLPSKPCLSKNFTFTILMGISYFAQVGMQRRRGHLLTFDRIRCLGLQGYDATQ